MDDTIFALASAAGRAGVAVWRISGPRAGVALAALTGRKLPAPRQAALRSILNPASGEPLDKGLVLWLPGPRSFTGEDCAELHTHGGRAIAEAMITALGGLGLREAEPGAFSRRAVLNGKFDLTQAEAIADLAAAETEAQRRQALAQAEGGLRDLYEGWRAEIVRLRAQIEAAIEFPDEDVGDPLKALWAALANLRGAIAAHLADSRRGERLRGGIAVAVVGAPNAGKSSLVNALARRDVAIVSPEAGTTRDPIEVHLDLGGYPVTIVDTAGLRQAEGAIEAEGIARARARVASADVVLALFDAAIGEDIETQEILDERAIAVFSKGDLAGRAYAHQPGERLTISVKTSAGIDKLLKILEERVKSLASHAPVPPPTRARHRDALARCVAALDAARAAPAPELAAEELRRAGDELGRITGRIDIEETLDAVFRDFCIGK